MQENVLFQQLSFIRMRTLALLDATTEEKADDMPDGFRNSIRWNLGHILFSHENLLYSFLGEQEKKALPDHYGKLFGYGTSPLTWKEEQLTPPSLSELRELLEEQPKRIENVFSGRLDEEGEKPFNLGVVTLTTLGDVFAFVNWHEGLHQGTITSIKRCQGIQDLFEKVEENVS
ncbi:DinB family protein [Rossellomorea aquimaris]|uniref:DinB family protein n=1 Tax=Rossellomorea aquimaris TaxID=189382 RepID=UPI001CD7343C|nr:DinB family protein [Rossellomorea aquimaris]MCA1055012.1 DinB family protein [Rossellomorea aquimaris]